MYETLEQSIIKLWKSRGLEVETMQFKSVGPNKYRWIIEASGGNVNVKESST